MCCGKELNKLLFAHIFFFIIFLIPAILLNKFLFFSVTIIIFFVNFLYINKLLNIITMNRIFIDTIEENTYKNFKEIKGVATLVTSAGVFPNVIITKILCGYYPKQEASTNIDIFIKSVKAL
jgi:hypothetical protein